jgi:hypothetical protein
MDAGEPETGLYWLTGQPPNAHGGRDRPHPAEVPQLAPNDGMGGDFDPNPGMTSR